jgi:hypothetical protein
MIMTNSQIKPPEYKETVNPQGIEKQPTGQVDPFVFRN